MPHHEKPPDIDGMVFLIIAIAPLMLGMSMAESRASRLSCVLITWLATHLMLAIWGLVSRKH
jgi:hypothetical protein